MDSFQVQEVNEWIGQPSLRNFHHELSPNHQASVEVPKLELNPPPSDLKYAFLGPNDTFQVVISSKLNSEQEGMLLNILNAHKFTIGWTLADIKGINPLVCTRKILLEEDAKSSREAQHRLNPNMKTIVKSEVLKLWDAGIIYPIFDSK